MFCKNCGNEIPDGSAICPRCGKPTADQNPQPVYQQPVYQQPGYQPNMVPQRVQGDGKGLSIAALVLGVIGVVLFWLPTINIVVLVCSILGIVFGAMGRKKSIAAYGRPSGLATAGLVLGIIGTAIAGIGVLSCTVCVCITGSALGAL